ncbi:MAG: glutamyl-tRNA reductase, partial [Gammaproteobacteria bacterium]
MVLLAIGVNHKTAPVEIREKVSFAVDRVPDALTELTQQQGVSEAVILSTCNRTEIYCGLADQDGQRVIEWFIHYHDLESSQIVPYLYTYPDRRAVEHVLQVASGLDSMILGEPQILGQLKSAYQTAVQTGTIGKLLGRLFQHTFAVAKQIRTDTAIGASPVSIA